MQSKGACCNVQGRVAARGRKRPSREAGKQVAVGRVVQGTTGGGGLADAGMERYLWAGMERGGQDLVELGLIKDDARLRKRTQRFGDGLIKAFGLEGASRVVGRIER